jgi:cobalt-zinc-cadmium efflux system membrane fusion protein
MKARWIASALATFLLVGCSVSKAAEPAAKATRPSSEVRLNLEQQTRIQLATAAVAVTALKDELTSTGLIALDTDHEAHVTPRLNGRVLKIDVSVGDRVSAGQRLALLDSADLGQAQSDFLQANADRVLAQKAFDREKALLAKDLAARKDYLQAEHDLSTSKVAEERTRNQLLLHGFNASQIAHLAETRQIDSTIPILAPLPGTVTARTLTIGEMVSPANPVFTLDNLAHPWALVDIYEKDLPRVHPGEVAEITTLSYPGRVYRGVVSKVSDILDPTSRTAKARVIVDNAHGDLKAAMFATARLHTPARPVLAMPATAVLHEGHETLVYRAIAPDRFAPATVSVGAEYRGLLAVFSGLQAGDQVVIHGALELRASGE